MQTNIGFMSRENASYLFNEGVLTMHGGIRDNLVEVNGSLIQRWSMFSEIRADIEKNVKSGHGILTLNDIVTLMRTNNLDKSYTQEGVEYVEKLSYQGSPSFLNNYIRVREDVDSRSSKRGRRVKEYSSF